MKKKFILSLIYILIFFNSNLLSEENNKILKVGLLAPLSGAYSQLGNSLLYSLQLALEEINDKNIFIVPRDSGFNNKESVISLAVDTALRGSKLTPVILLKDSLVLPYPIAIWVPIDL